MPAGIGYSYQPGAAQTTDLPMQAGTAPSSPQEAIRLLSLRLPKQAGPGAIAPLPLLDAAGGAGGGQPLQQLLMALMRAFGSGGPGGAPGMAAGPGPAGPSAGGSMSIPPPRIVPGDQGERPPVQIETPPVPSPGRQVLPSQASSFRGWMDQENALNGRGGGVTPLF